MSASAHIITNGKDSKTLPIINVSEFLDEYYQYRSRPEPPLPYLYENGHIASLTYYIKAVEDALKEKDDKIKLKRVEEIIKDFNTPKAVA